MLLAVDLEPDLPDDAIADSDAGALRVRLRQEFDPRLLDRWIVGTRLAPCLKGLATGHPRLIGENRPIYTSELWLLSEDRSWARTLSRWYRVGRPADIPGLDS